MRRPTSWWLRVFLALAIVVPLMMLGLPFVLPRSRPAADRTEALNNIRQVGLALSDFESEYGKFPDASTAEAVNSKHPSDLKLGAESSNQIFRQLLANGLKSEKPFWCKTAWSPRKPDDIFIPAKALQPGEVGFAYIAGRNSRDDPSTPLIVAPLIPGTTRFDPNPYKGKAIILQSDGSASAMQIREDNGEVWLDGKNLFDPSQPFWKDRKPDIKWAETK
jgi:hypothetical protein